MRTLCVLAMILCWGCDEDLSATDSVADLGSPLGLDMDVPDGPSPGDATVSNLEDMATTPVIRDLGPDAAVDSAVDASVSVDRGQQMDATLPMDAARLTDAEQPGDMSALRLRIGAMHPPWSGRVPQRHSRLK